MRSASAASIPVPLHHPRHLHIARDIHHQDAIQPRIRHAPAAFGQQGNGDDRVGRVRVLHLRRGSRARMRGCRMASKPAPCGFVVEDMAAHAARSSAIASKTSAPNSDAIIRQGRFARRPPTARAANPQSATEHAFAAKPRRPRLLPDAMPPVSATQ
jgi:hypothetical protein